MERLTVEQLADLEQRSNDYIAMYGHCLAGSGSGPPSPEETLALVAEIREWRLIASVDYMPPKKPAKKKSTKKK